MKVLLTFLFLIFSSIQIEAAEAFHGMVIFGKDKLYAYHLPMFHHVHNKQMVLTFEVPQNVKNVITKFQDDNYLTFVPSMFDLDKFIANPFALTGDLYAGHFEKKGVILLKDITLLNPQIVYLNTISKDSNNESGAKLELYKFFGTSSDIYALHLINGGEEIDQIFKLTPTKGNAVNIENVIHYRNLSNYKLLELNLQYDVSDLSCRTRLCDEDSGKNLATFKTEALYFEDQVM